MNRLPSLTGEQVIKALSKAPDFRCSGKEAAMFYLKHLDGRSTVVPVYKGKSLGRGLLGKIMPDAELSREEFLKLL